MDATLSKAFAVTERYALKLRGEFQNLFNHATFELPGHVALGLLSAQRPAGSRHSVGLTAELLKSLLRLSARLDVTRRIAFPLPRRHGIAEYLFE